MSAPLRQSLLIPSIGPVTAVAAFRATPSEKQAAHSRTEARGILRALVREIDTSDQRVLRELAAMAAADTLLAPTPTLLNRVQAALDAGTLLFVPGWAWRPRPAPLDWQVPPDPDAPPPPRSAGSSTATFELLIIDRRSRAPLSGVPLAITPPDGSTCEVSTDGEGRAKLPGLEPGHCSVRSLIANAELASSYAFAEMAAAPGGGAGQGLRPPDGPAFLVEVERRRLRTGDTPEVIARSERVPWDDIARFNWGTFDPEILERRYRDSLGCLRTTPDGSSIVFDDQDDPGLILIPKPWETTLAIGPVHRVLVSPLRTVVLKLENEAGLRLPGVGYEARFADGSRYRGRLGRSGLARVEGVAEGPFAVSYPDELDVLATSLAASVRKGFDEQATGPLFTLLMQDQPVIERASAVYAQYFNDLTGQGLVADIDQVVTDPEARPPLLALCAIAGLSVRGVSHVQVDANL